MSTGKDYRDNLPTLMYDGNSKSKVKEYPRQGNEESQPELLEKGASESKAEETIANLPHTFVQISFTDLELGNCCGEGSFGTVYKAKWKSQGGKEVAVKTLHKMDEEVHIISILSHRNIIQFYGACSEKPNYCLVTEFALYGSLYSFLSSSKSESLEFSQMLSWARDIALGMNYLHDEAPVQIVHRDLKSKNILICQDFVLKICDFGASRLFDETTVMTTMGTYPWMAPELIQGKPTSEMCDVYSYGVVLWELLTREVPFKGLQGFQVAWIVVEKEERPLIPTTCPTRLSELMKSCWLSDATQRPSFHELCVEIEGMLDDNELEKETDSFVHAKDDWMQEVKSKMKDIHHQETKFEAKKDKCMEREQILKQWAENLRNELREKSLHNIVHFSKTHESFNCQFSSSVSADVDSDTVKSVVNQFMSNSTAAREDKIENFQSVHSPTSIISLPLSRQGSSSSVESARSLSLHSDMNYDMSKMNISSSPISFLDSCDLVKPKDMQKSVNRNRTKLQKQMSTSSTEEFQYEGLKLARGANGRESPLNGNKGLNLWESKSKYQDCQENYVSKNESMKRIDNISSPTSPGTMKNQFDNASVFDSTFVDEAIKQLKSSGYDVDLPVNFAIELSKCLQDVSKKRSEKASLPPLTPNSDYPKPANMAPTRPSKISQHSPTLEKSLSFERNRSSFSKKEQKQSSKLFQAKANDFSSSALGRNLNRVNSFEKNPKSLCKSIETQTDALSQASTICYDKGTQTADASSGDQSAANQRKILFHCLQQPRIAEICEDVPMSQETDKVEPKVNADNEKSKKASNAASGNARMSSPGPSSITTQSINNSLASRRRHGLDFGCTPSPRRRVTVTGAPLIDNLSNRRLNPDLRLGSPPLLSPQVHFENAIDISGGRQSVYETNDFTYILRPSMSR